MASASSPDQNGGVLLLEEGADAEVAGGLGPIDALQDQHDVNQRRPADIAGQIQILYQPVEGNT
jgi:hypothetical protein